MIGVIVPVQNEEASLAACLASLLDAAAHPALAVETVRIAVVLDACTDFSGAIARGFGIDMIAVDVCNVGIGRAKGVWNAHTLTELESWSGLLRRTGYFLLRHAQGRGAIQRLLTAFAIATRFGRLPV